MSEYIFTDQESLPDRPFADPIRTEQDLQVIRAIITALLDVVADARRKPSGTLPAVIFRQTAAQSHRFVINTGVEFCALPTSTLVAFFGARRLRGNVDQLNETDTLLVSEFSAHPGMLAYCSYQIDATEYGNLVLFDSPTAKLHWSDSRHHAYAADVLAPGYYRSIRLHSGRMNGPLAGRHTLILESTRYFDYVNKPADRPVWRGRREYTESPSV